ncbi:TIGR01459 family HAD-type hydrolase [Marivivens donghaensis]|uniref:TIGR01459 family HAD-type hydrolase n=1 Tax=Marivivens donghaensis TaxID=1699413 RepID=A0ABX0VSX5_9RHOB|nr:TIGR01459 family HAD-type hydrolase [Marivivens donghaensis]NIY71048.1 TIGR01459 family HAD-type hydrolase [Marivivens donghaensis]
MTQIINSFAEISDQYDAAFVDLWGCMHNGIEAFSEAVAAMQAYRQSGGKVIYVTNAPRAWPLVVEQMKNWGLPDDTWDAISTSGDAARVAMFSGAVGEKVWFIGEDRDLTFFNPIKVVENPVDIQRVPLDDAEGIVNCGPFDPQADPQDMRPQLLLAREKGLKMLCANPDIIIDRGDKREWCAGAVAKVYEEMGGETLYFGKPHPPIYDLARRRLLQEGIEPDEAQIICIGDGIKTDISGAQGEGYDSLFITGGIAAEETKTETQPDADALSAYLEKEMQAPTYSIGFLS